MILININKKDYSNDHQDTKVSKERYNEISKLEANEVLNEFTVSERGLSNQQVLENRKNFGTNKVETEKRASLLSRIFSAFINPFTAILLVLAIVSAATDIFIPMREGNTEEIDIMTVVIILSMVLISGLLRFIQETRSGNAAAKLLKMITTTTCVERIEIGKSEIPLDDVVVGDIVHLAAGDMVPAELRIIEAKDLFISQSALTGESDPLEKVPIPSTRDFGDLTDIPNIAFMGTNVISGSAIGVVISTGNSTFFGNMSKTINKKPAITSFEKGVNSVSWVLIRFMLVMVPIVFFVNGYTKGDWNAAFLFSITVAVGLTPEMLPMIVTTCLAKGAVSMAKKKTIIKNLNSMQNFGSIDILCTDKTGTITQDLIALEYHLNISEKSDPRVLKHAYLNSHFQTGLKNLLDLAIITATNEEAPQFEILQNLDEQYTKVDEVPFDFNRRRMSVVVEDKFGKTQLITKGAVEEMLAICSSVEYNGTILELDEKFKKDITKTVDGLNDKGMRVLAIAQKTNPSPVGAFGVKDEADMVLLGYLAFLDPPKLSTMSAIKSLAKYGVTTKIITGDNDRVTRAICKKVGIPVNHLLLGSDISKMTDEELSKNVMKTDVFAKISPEEKARIVTILRKNGHTVGYMGDGINDAAAMKASDIGISVDTAVDIAKESADVILLEKDLMVLEDGIIEGRKTYANMIKYIKMTASSNFGNVFSVLVASALIPFLPMLSVHLIFLNLIYDISCTAIPWDNVDEEFLHVPRKWDASSIASFMLWIGPTSSVFDMTTYLIMYYIICPMFVSNGLLFTDIPTADIATRSMYIAMFQAGWFVESMWSQTLVIHMIRTPKVPFFQSRASFSLTALTCLGIGVLSIIPYTSFGHSIGLASLPSLFWVFLIITIILYMTLATVLKKAYVRYYGELL